MEEGSSPWKWFARGSMVGRSEVVCDSADRFIVVHFFRMSSSLILWKLVRLCLPPMHPFNNKVITKCIRLYRLCNRLFYENKDVQMSVLWCLKYIFFQFSFIYTRDIKHTGLKKTLLVRKVLNINTVISL